MNRGVELAQLIYPSGTRAGSEIELPVYSVTKHAGFVQSSKYFKKTVHGKNLSTYKVVRRGDFAYATIHLDEGSIGVAPEDCLISPMYTVFAIDRERIESEYLLALLKSPGMLAKYSLLGSGSVHRRKSIPLAVLSRTRIPLPELEEQRRISKTLTQTAIISNRYGNLASVVTAQGRATFRDMFGSPREGWSTENTARVRNVGRVQLGRQRAPKYQTGKYAHPYMRVANVLENCISLESVHTMDFDAKDFTSYKLEYGDILLNEGQSTELVGRPSMWRNEIEDCCFQNTLVRFQADRSIIEPEYALWLFLELFKVGDFAKMSSKTSNLAHLGAGRFGDMIVPVPPLDQQREFAQQVAKIGELSSAATTARENAQELYDSLQYHAFRGEL